MKLTLKIISTIVCSIAISLVLYAFVKFCIAVHSWDDDEMFFWGLGIASVSGMGFLVMAFVNIIEDTWKRGDKKK